MKILDWIVFTLFFVNVAYLLVFALASLKKRSLPFKPVSRYRRIAVLIPAYKEDAVVEECVSSCLNQDYPKETITVVVISDRMKDETNERLSTLPIKLVIADYEESTKSKALNLAMSSIEDHDIALVFDADNTVDPDFFNRLNVLFEHDDVRIVQAHRVAKNLNNSMAILDAVSEESNNSIFRQGHYSLGLSSALIGSGMAFDYTLFKQKMLTIHAVGGFDRNLELSFLRDGERIHYLPDAYVYDEKVQNGEAFSNQRKRWMSAQLHYFMEFRSVFPNALMHGNVDFCIKFLQQLAIPRVLLLGFIPIYAVMATLIEPAVSVKWWLLFVMLCLALGVAIPRKLINKQLAVALAELPKVFYMMVKNLFRLKGANKKFIHTQHGVQ